MFQLHLLSVNNALQDKFLSFQGYLWAVKVVGNSRWLVKLICCCYEGKGQYNDNDF